MVRYRKVNAAAGPGAGVMGLRRTLVCEDGLDSGRRIDRNAPTAGPAYHQYHDSFITLHTKSPALSRIHPRNGVMA